MSDQWSYSSTGDRGPAGETAICSLNDGLQFRGYRLEQLIAEASFLEVAHLLLHGELPDQDRQADLQACWLEHPALEDNLAEWLETVPMHVPLDDVVQVGLSLLAIGDSRRGDRSPQAIWQSLTRLLGQLPLLIASRCQGATANDRLELRDDLTFAGNIIWLLNQREPTMIEDRAICQLLICAAEHEFSPATYAVRLAAGARADFSAAVLAGYAVLQGAQYGGVARQISAMFDMLSSPEAAEMWAQAMLARQARLPGFGHPLHQRCDPRAEILQPICLELAAERQTQHLEAIAEAVNSVVQDEQQLAPTFAWPAVRLLKHLGWSADLAVPLLAIARMSGWAAHYLEQWQDTRPMRPRAKFLGSTARRYRSPEERG